MEATQALDCHDLPGAQAGQRLADRVTGQLLAACVEQVQPWTAVGAARGFGVETTVGRIGVFGSTGLAQRKGGQAGARPIVGNAMADRVTRAAVRAGGEGVAPAPASRVAEVGDAIRADRGIRADGGVHHPRRALHDGKACCR